MLELRSKEKELSLANFHKAFVLGKPSATGNCTCGAFCFDASGDWGEEHAKKVREWYDKSHIDKEPAKYSPINGAVKKIAFGGKGWVIGCKCQRNIKIKGALDASCEEAAKYLNLEAERLLNKAVDLTVSGKASQ